MHDLVATLLHPGLQQLDMIRFLGRPWMMSGAKRVAACGGLREIEVKRNPEVSSDTVPGALEHLDLLLDLASTDAAGLEQELELMHSASAASAARPSFILFDRTT